MFTSLFGAIFNDDDFEVCFALPCKTVQQLLHLIRAVVDRDNQG